MPDVSFGVVLVNWNGHRDTVAALDSLRDARERPAHVVVVDNGSSDDSLDVLREWATARAPTWREVGPGSGGWTADDAGWLTLIAAGENLGFSGGNNVGLRYLASRTADSHFLLLNNDAMVAPEYFAELRAMLRAHPDAGLVGSLIFRHPERDRVWFAGGYEVPRRALVLHHYDAPDTERPYATDFVTGCAMLIARALYDAEGGLPEIYNPIYWEDADYSYRARTGGWRVMIAPRAHVYHRVGASGAGETLTPRTAHLLNRNRGYYVRRNYRGLDRASALAYLIATKPARALVEIARGNRAVGAAMFRGFVQGMFGRVT